MSFLNSLNGETRCLSRLSALRIRTKVCRAFPSQNIVRKDRVPPTGCHEPHHNDGKASETSEYCNACIGMFCKSRRLLSLSKG
jgi:hypothetical protein